MTIWLCVIVQTVGEEWFTEFICPFSDWVERFRISQPVNSVIVTTIRKHTVEMWIITWNISISYCSWPCCAEPDSEWLLWHHSRWCWTCIQGILCSLSLVVQSHKDWYHNHCSLLATAPVCSQSVMPVCMMHHHHHHHHHHHKCLVPGLQWTGSAWQYKSQYNKNSKLIAIF